MEQGSQTLIANYSAATDYAVCLIRCKVRRILTVHSVIVKKKGRFTPNASHKNDVPTRKNAGAARIWVKNNSLYSHRKTWIKQKLSQVKGKIENINTALGLVWNSFSVGAQLGQSENHFCDWLGKLCRSAENMTSVLLDLLILTFGCESFHILAITMCWTRQIHRVEATYSRHSFTLST